MGLFDAIKSAFGGSDESEETADETAAESATDADEATADTSDAGQSGGGTTATAASGSSEPGAGGSSSESAATEGSSDGVTAEGTPDRNPDDGADGVAARSGEDDSESKSGEGSFEISSRPSKRDSTGTEADESGPAEKEPAEKEGGFQWAGDRIEDSAAESSTDEPLSPDDESGFDHLTTEEIDDGPDMAEEASEFITEAEGEIEDHEEPDDVDSIPEDDPRAEFVEQAEDLVAFWSEYELQYTLESLQNLDEMVEEQWDAERFEDVEFGGDDYDSQVFTDTVTQLGSYFGEVLVREQEGTWQQETGVGWTVNVPAGPNSEATGATVTVFQVAEDCLTGPSTFTGMHDALADRLNLTGRAGDGDTPVDLDRADIETVATDNEIEDAAERLRAGAEDLAERWPGYDLDFTVESLDRLEELLAEEVDRSRFEGVELGDETDRESMLLTAHVVGVAGYLSEVLRRQHGAEWADRGRMVLVVQHGDSQTRIDPIEVAIASVRGKGSLAAAVPDFE